LIATNIYHRMSSPLHRFVPVFPMVVYVTMDGGDSPHPTRDLSLCLLWLYVAMNVWDNAYPSTLTWQPTKTKGQIPENKYYILW